LKRLIFAPVLIADHTGSARAGGFSEHDAIPVKIARTSLE
jgi:hypothetical protein